MQAGEGNKILLKRKTDNNVLTFSYASGDCPSGCLYNYDFVFEVKGEKARFLGSGGYIEKY